MRDGISIAIIVKNAEATFDRCLSTFSEVADEVIVVDTGSTDKTIEIAKKYEKVKLFYFEWINDFSAARNYSFSKCTKKWIFWVDADDYILPEDIEKVKKLDFSGKEIIICNYVYAHDEWGNSLCNVPRERIVRRNLDLKFEEPIHEFLSLQGRKIFISEINTHHNKQHGSSERNLQMLEKIVQEKDSSRNIYYLAKEYFDYGPSRIDDAIYYLTMFVNRPDGWWEDRYTAYFKLAMCYLSKKDDQKFLDNIWESIKMEDRRAEPFYELATFWLNKGSYDKAIQWYETCLNRRRPKDLLASYQPEYYDFLPSLQACLAYNHIGDIKKAYEYNRKSLEYRPKDPRALNNDKILSKALKVPLFNESRKGKVKEPESLVSIEPPERVIKDGEGKKLNLGCGNKQIPGYVNCDLFPGPVVDEVFDLDDIPYKDGTISGISSEHALEHVGWKRAEKAIKEWFRVLKPGGELLLKIPDLEECCRGYLNSTVEGAGTTNGIPNKKWFSYTIYGIQTSQAGEPDEAQVHRCGYSKEEIGKLLEDTGFILDYNERYSGYGTPSLGIRALKPVSAIRVGWIAPMNWDAAQTRIRVLNVDRWLRSRGYQSKVVDYPDIINKNYDIAIVGKSFDEVTFNNIKELKRLGKTVYVDICESLYEFAWVKEIVALGDKVICCSYKLAELTRPINPNVIVIEDSWEP